MKVTRRSLPFYTLNQLAGLIKDEWDRELRSDEANLCLDVLHRYDDPESVESVLTCLAAVSKLVELLSDWQYEHADLVLRELKQRIDDYRKRLEPPPKLSLPVVFTGLD